jgi:hypothetical protein
VEGEEMKALDRSQAPELMDRRAHAAAAKRGVMLRWRRERQRGGA